MRILVIGGTGLLGGYLLRRLIQKKCHIDLITRNPANLTVVSDDIHPIVIDIAKKDWLHPSELCLADYDVIYHLAYATSGDEAYDRAVTVDSVCVLNNALRELADDRERHFIYVGSMVVFGANPDDRTVTEASPKRGDTLYAKQKIAATKCAMVASPSLLCTVLHLTGVYTEFSSRIDSYRAILMHNYIPNHLSKKSINNIVHADDVSYALVLCIDRPRDQLAEEYIINGEIKPFVEWFSELSGTVRCRSWLYLPSFTRYVCRGGLRRFLNIIGIGCPLPYAEKKGSVFDQETVYSSEKARQHFGFNPQITFRQVCEQLKEGKSE
jgi:nucleoside-diphosphate-sugar epimerase